MERCCADLGLLERDAHHASGGKPLAAAPPPAAAASSPPALFVGTKAPSARRPKRPQSPDGEADGGGRCADGRKACRGDRPGLMGCRLPVANKQSYCSVCIADKRAENSASRASESPCVLSGSAMC